MRTAITLVLGTQLLVAAAKTALECFRENTETTIGSYDPTRSSFTDATMIANSDYVKGLSIRTIMVCEGFFSD